MTSLRKLLYIYKKSLKKLKSKYFYKYKYIIFQLKEKEFSISANNTCHKRLFNDYLERQKTLNVLEQKYLLNESEKYPFFPITNKKFPRFHKIFPSLMETEVNKNKNHIRPKTKSFFSYTCIRKTKTANKNRKISKINQNNISFNTNFMNSKISTINNLYNNEINYIINKQKTFRNIDQNIHNKEISLDVLKKNKLQKRNPPSLTNNIIFQQSKKLTTIPINSEYRQNSSKKRIFNYSNSGKILKSKKFISHREIENRINNNQYSSILNVEKGNSTYFTDGYVKTESLYQENHNSNNSKIALTKNSSLQTSKISLNSSNFENYYKNSKNSTSSKKIIITSSSSENYYNNNSYKFIYRNHLSNNPSALCFKIPKNDVSNKIFEKHHLLNKCICGLSESEENKKMKNNYNVDSSLSTNYMDILSLYENKSSSNNISNLNSNNHSNYNKNLSKNIIKMPSKVKNMNNLKKNNYNNCYKISTFEIEFNSKENSMNKRIKNDSNNNLIKKKEIKHNYRKINGQIKQIKGNNRNQFFNEFYIEKSNDFNLIHNEKQNSNTNKFNDLCISQKEVNGNINPINSSNGADNLRLSQNSQMTTQSISDSKILEIANFYLAKDENVDRNVINGILSLKNKGFYDSFK